MPYTVPTKKKSASAFLVLHDIISNIQIQKNIAKFNANIHVNFISLESTWFRYDCKLSYEQYGNNKTEAK